MSALHARPGLVWRAANCLLLLAVTAAPMRAQFFVPEAAATVSVAEGRVSVLRDGQAWALFAGNEVHVGQTIVTGPDGFAHLAVSDGSSFLIYPNSRAVFRKNPGSLTDLIDLVIGRVKVYIERLGGEPNPHRIFTPTAVISVRGTTFDVSVTEYEATVIAVEDGLVAVQHRLHPRSRETSVGAGETLTVYANEPLAKAGVDRVRAVELAGDLARTAAMIWSRIGGGGAPGGGGGRGGGLPGDDEAPAPPPPPPGP